MGVTERPRTPEYTIEDVGTERVLYVSGVAHRTRYSERVLRLLIERKGALRAPLYLPFKLTRGEHFLGALFRYLDAHGRRDLNVLEVGCSFGHITEYLDEHPLVARIATFDVDPGFVEIARVKAAELPLEKVGEIHRFTDEETTRLPWPDGHFDLVVAIGVVEHLPSTARHRYVDEYYRVLASAGHIAILDTPNRAFPLETHSVGLPGIQWLPPKLAWAYARSFRPRRVRGASFQDFSTGAWRNASWFECLPSRGVADLVDVTEQAGYGWRFFRETARSRTRRALLPYFALATRVLATTGRPPSLALPYFNLVFRKAR